MTHGVLTGLYLDYFSQNELYYLSHGVFSDFVKSSYNFAPANQIGYIFFGNHKMSANANIWADAYANFGFIGVIVFSIILLFYLWILDNSAVNKKQPIIFALASTTYVLTDTALLTSFLTHGLLILLVTVILMPTEEHSNQ
jgi:TM2 domain-containing membrane protein YozV